MNRTVIISLLILCLIGLSGCMTVREVSSGNQWDDNAMFLLERGKSTAKDIAYAFGSPQKEILGGEKGRIWVYFYNHGKYIFEGQINHGMAEGEHNALTLWFNKDGILTDISYTFNRVEDLNKMKLAEQIEKRMQNQEGGGQ
jgi:outer membrane protein assembly factor BamE (lipoprotein component of BamABCDE complex)